MQIEVSFKNDKKKVEIVDQMQSSEFMANVAKAFKQKPSRTRIQVESSDAKKIYLTPAKPLSAQVSENTRLVLKYVGPQINYRTVFILEYLGPIIIWLLVAPLRSIASVMWLFHYVKRELETLFVHQFSNDTMPIRNVFKNCSYYWGFALINALNSPVAWFSPAQYFIFDREIVLPVSIDKFLPIVFFFLSEFMNFKTHLILKNLRPKNSREYVNPQHPLFRQVACPNYGFEVLSWVFFSVYCKTVSSVAFTIAGLIQIWAWAGDKKKKLYKVFGNEGKRKWRLVWGLI
ncbi:Synaptic_glycoprotein SC2 [Hexamita inflata]|uniref:Synaptic glycoprotein SC2 n=1 Tax=Hexamita inflata TaxID=28002 RepID=A0AA86NY08_9EUKA|nr:Synaptic glycoprotein SC2 [Hexamita inflata]